MHAGVAPSGRPNVNIVQKSHPETSQVRCFTQKSHRLDGPLAKRIAHYSNEKLQRLLAERKSSAANESDSAQLKLEESMAPYSLKPPKAALIKRFRLKLD